MRKIQFYLTPSEGKILIGKAIAALPDVQTAMKENTVVVIAGTTNAPLAYELLKMIGDTDGFSHRDFIRGVTVPRGVTLKTDFIGDVVIQKGKWLKGKTIPEIENELTQKDVVFKGANAVNLEDKEAAVLIGNDKVGTALPIISAVYGRRTKLYIPVGTEKRVGAKISQLAALVNDRESEGLRLLPLPGEVITELEAVSILSKAKATLVSGGGVLGAEGGAYYMAEGTSEQLDALQQVLDTVRSEKDLFW